MLTHGLTWQGMIAKTFSWVICLVAIFVLTLISGYFNWWIIFSNVLTLGITVFLRLIPMMLNLSRSYYRWIVLFLLMHTLVTIVTFALHHMSVGIIDTNGLSELSFWDAIYFSVTTFTTLGYGDFQPLPEMRLATSAEALIGMVSVALAVAIIWLWCQENLVDKEMAYFDGYRRHKTSLARTRIRVRTITGKKRCLKNWMPAPQPEEKFYYDKERAEWLEVLSDTDLPDNALVIRVVKED